MLDPNPGIFSPASQVEAKAATHFPPGRPVSDRDPGEIEREVEPDDGRAPDVAILEEDFRAKLLDSHQLDAMCIREGIKSNVIGLRERFGIDKDAFPFELLSAPDLKEPKVQSLDRIYRGFAVKYQCPF